MRRRHRIGAPAAALLLAAASLPGATTEAAALACGDVITEDTTLEHDLLDCPDDGLIIAADNVTLRLNGFMIEGPSPPSTDTFDRVGVDISGRSRVAVLGPGVIRKFGVGVFDDSDFSSADRARVSKITFIDVNVAISFSSSRGLFDNNTAINTDLESHALCGGRLNLRRSGSFVGENSIVANRLNQVSIFSTRGTSGNTIRSNTIFPCENTPALRMTDEFESLVNDNRIFGVENEGSSIQLFRFVIRIKVTNNVVDGTIQFLDGGVERNQIYLNVVQGASVGIFVGVGGSGFEQLDNTIEANRFLDNEDPIRDEGTDTIVRNNFCDPPDIDPPCSTDFDPGEVVDSDVDSVLDRDDECPDTDFQAAVVINGIDTNLANVLTERSGCTMMDLIHEAAIAADDRGEFIGAVALLTRTWLEDDLIDDEDAGIIRRAASGSPPL